MRKWALYQWATIFTCTSALETNMRGGVRTRSGAGIDFSSRSPLLRRLTQRSKSRLSNERRAAESFGSAIRGLYKSPVSLTFRRSHNLESLGIGLDEIFSACQKFWDDEYIEEYILDKFGYSSTTTTTEFLCYGMYNNDVAIGFAVVKHIVAKNYYIEYFCASKGYGKFLMRHIQHDLCASGCSINLYSVASAGPFYKKMGFVTRAGEDKNYHFYDKE